MSSIKRCSYQIFFSSNFVLYSLRSEYYSRGGSILLVDFLENVFKAAVVFLEDGILGGEIQRPTPLESVLEGSMCKARDRFVRVVHSKTNSTGLEFIDIETGRLSTALGGEDDLKGAWFSSDKVCGTVLIAKGVTTDDNGLFPAWDESGDSVDNDGFTEDGSIQDVSDCPVRRLPHLLQIEF
jgi:hypothetical protein